MQANVEQLITAIQKLRPEERTQVAKALIQAELSSNLTTLIEELYAQSPVNDVSDEDIMVEIRAVRQQPRQ